MKKIAVLQSNYIPWKGYFDIIASVDEFIIYDQVQYTKNDWRNRNKIKTAHGLSWLTIPVKNQGLTQKISETMVIENGWQKKHWQSIRHAYTKAPFFKLYQAAFEEIYMSIEISDLSKINLNFLKAICKLLNINTIISNSEDYLFSGNRVEKLINLVKAAGGTHYLSGQAAKSYIEESVFIQSGIQLEWMTYEGYPEYPQLYPPFEHKVTVLDLLFNAGDEASKFMLFQSANSEIAILPKILSEPAQPISDIIF
ncbi:MAG: WbqC family protein [Verrucomicrobia bacterium]|nr:WbqC family protein [Cytophagales bacterium]